MRLNICKITLKSMLRTGLIFILITSCLTRVSAQDTLPRISVKQMGEKVIISWKNEYGKKVSTINIQRSADSIRNFSTIGSVLNPLNEENGFVDAKVNGGHFFYRVFVAFEGGTYIFSNSYRPVKDSVVITEEPKEIKTTTPSGFVPSKFVYTGRDNNVILHLPGAENRKLSIRFFDSNDKTVLKINHIPESYLIIEKVNFVRSGWYYYELFDNEILIEKYKLYIPKDGKSSMPVPETRKAQ